MENSVEFILETKKLLPQMKRVTNTPSLTALLSNSRFHWFYIHNAKFRFVAVLIQPKSNVFGISKNANLK